MQMQMRETEDILLCVLTVRKSPWDDTDKILALVGHAEHEILG